MHIIIPYNILCLNVFIARCTMNSDMVFFEGERTKPLIVFIHGLGMDKNIWVNPSESYMLGGSLAVSALLSKIPTPRNCGTGGKRPETNLPGISAGIRPEKLITLFEEMRSKGYPVVTWSQKRPVGPIELAVAELTEIIDSLDESKYRDIVMAGHSRGGLIARKYLMNERRSIKGLITICTPNRGSSIARLARYMSPLSKIISQLLGDIPPTKGRLNALISRITDLLESKAIEELLPGSEFLDGLDDKPLEGVFYITVGGTSPQLFNLYRWKWETQNDGSRSRWVQTPERIISFPEIVEKVIPVRLFPDELKEGLGDGMVTAESSKIPWHHNHHNFPLNHAAVLFDKDVHQLLSSAIESL